MLTEIELATMQAACIRVQTNPSASNHGTISSINEFGAQMFGYAPQELIGQPLSTLIPKRDQEKQEKGFDKATDNHAYSTSSFIVNAQHKDGSVFTIWHRIGKCQDPQGKTYFVAIVFKMSAPDVRF